MVEFDGSEERVHLARVRHRIRQHRCDEAALVLGCDGRVATAPEGETSDAVLHLPSRDRIKKPLREERWSNVGGRNARPVENSLASPRGAAARPLAFAV